MNLQQSVEFCVRMLMNDGASKEEAWKLTLELAGVRS